MKKYSIYAGCLVLALGLGMAMPVNAQNKKKARTSKASLMIEVRSTITDTDGNPITNAVVTADEGISTTVTDENGNFVIQAKANGTVLIEADGYHDAVVRLASKGFPKQLKLKRMEPFFNMNNVLSRNDGGETKQSRTVGAVSTISGEDLNSYPDFCLSNTFQGKMAGVVAEATVNGLANNSSNIYVRGQHRNSDNTAIVIVDGIERDWDDIIPEEVEKIEVLKDATAKILYGSRAANGVVVITTRRGKANRRVIKTTLEAGVMFSTRTPQYLNSAQYAELYNEARVNDGLMPFYSQQQIDGYKNSTGVNDLYYPNVDFYNQFTHEQRMYRKAIFDLNGGTDKVRYALVASYIGGNGLEKVGDRPDMNRINVRGNLDIKATDFLSVVADGAMRLENRSLGKLNNSEIFTQLSTTRPNEYPMLINPDVMGRPASETGVPFFGASLSHPDNLYADMLYGGNTQERYIVSQTNLGLDFNLNKLVKGLTASAFITFDNYSYFKKGQTNIYPTYAILGKDNGLMPDIFQMRKEELSSEQEKMDDSTYRTLGWRGNFGYQNKFQKHSVSAVLTYNFYNKEFKGETQDIKNSNTTLRLNYGYADKYLVEGTAALMGSNRFVGSGRYFTGGAAGAAWILSKEDFMKDFDMIDFLKIKASWGLLGYDKSTDFLLYNTAWNEGGTVNIGSQNTTKLYYTSYIRTGADLKWETSNEWNVGLEGVMLGDRLNFEVNYFNEKRDNIIGLDTADYADVLGTFVSYKNIGRVDNHGIDAYIQWRDKIGDVNYQIGANIVWSKNKLVEWSEVNYPEAGMHTVGLPTDVITGYQALGLYGKDVNLDNGIFQTFGECNVGDIAYADQNGDKIIDGRDITAIGNTFPRTSLGVDFSIGYKGWNLYVLGTSELGLKTLKNNSYYWVKGEDKYSEVVLDRYHPENNPTGSYPRLTTTDGTNNFINSTYWIQDASFFRLKNVELSYTFDFSGKKICKGLKLFARGTNLFVISKEKNLDPEVMNAGVTNYPMYTTVTGGLSVSF